LFNLREIRILNNLANPKLDTERVQNDITELVVSHVKKVRVDVNTNWTERNYKDLQYNITDLRQMENHFKTYEDVFPESWSTGIAELIEKKIEDFGKQGRSYLTTSSNAKESKSDFRRCFVEMGSVLIELPVFSVRNTTKTIMSDVLEYCLSFDWGTNYIFQLGICLQHSEDASDDEIHVAHSLLGKFRHFKDVLTLIWNSEIEQKPPEDTIKKIIGHDASDGNSVLNCDEQISD